MRLVMVRDGGERRVGALVGQWVVDLAALARDHSMGTVPPDLRALIEAGDPALEVVRSLLDLPAARQEGSPYRLPLSEMRLLAPLDPPCGNVLAIGRNYLEHVREHAAKRGDGMERPTVFTKAQTSVTGPYDDIPVDPAVTAQVDWEVELGVAIGRGGKNIPREQALEHVFGYTVVNDLSARDVQYGWGGQFFKGKSLDGFCPMGPCIVTADEVPDPQTLRLTLRLNGETWQDASTNDMIFPVDELIEQLSLGMTLPPGTLIATGTPAGTGYGASPQRFLQEGDVVEAEVEGIGCLRNRITRA